MSQVKRKSKQLGQILIELGYITAEQLETALEEHRKTPKSLGRVLIDLGMIKESDLVRALAEQVGLEFVDLGDFQVDPMVTALLPEALARRYRALPIGERDGRLLVAMSDPANVYALDDIRTITGRDVLPVVSTANDVEAAIQKYSGMDSGVEAMASIVDAANDEDEESDLDVAVEDAPIVKLVNAIMTQAVADRASDVHIEPREHDFRIRFRVDGVLMEPMPPAPKNIQNGLISRMKVMADLNIAEKRIPQDGRISMKVGGRKIDLRVATLPTVYGEKVVLRILDTSNALLRLEDLGFLEDAYKRYSASFNKPYGAILVTGPTGSGKSTTMYGTLNILNQIDKNIITVEDPVEYRLAGVNQMQVNVKAGLTFAAALRSILRADPDIVLVGEIRDRETAVIAVEASLTGHLVLSTLHTNDAASTPLRLMDMGVPRYMVGGSLQAVLAQRLVRVICESCTQPFAAPAPERAWLRAELGDRAESVPLFHGRGCSHCNGTGYRGRTGVYELLEMTRAVHEAINHPDPGQFLKAAHAEMRGETLRRSAVRLAVQGKTTIAEAMRVSNQLED
jgi:MSHA biogenesis protein MshE